MEKIKKIVDLDILTIEDIQERIINKKNYLPEEEESKISSEFNVNNWVTFLPPLNPVVVKKLESVGQTFEKQLHDNILSGNNEQFEQLSVLKGKIRNFSLQLQNKIHTAVGKATLLLENINSELLVENSCCYDGDKNTLQYFEEKENGINLINSKVNELEHFNKSIQQLGVPYFLTDPRDTKFKYPIVSKTFSSETIYNAFIKYCYFNTGLIIDDNYSALCGKNSSNFKDSDDIKTKIDILRSEGKNYNLDSFVALMDIINKQNIVQIDMGTDTLTSLLNFENYINNENVLKDIADTPLINLFNNLNTHIKRKTQLISEDEEIALHLFLKEENDILLDNITRGLNDSKDFNKVTDFLNTVDIWKMRGENIYISNSDETSLTYNTFVTSFINNILTIYPEIILNEINFSNIPIPSHWTGGSQKLSETHVSDIKNIILNEYLPFKKYYSNPELNSIIESLKNNPIARVIKELTKLIPFIADLRISKDEERVETIFNGKNY